jgi:HAMP domain-containing protein
MNLLVRINLALAIAFAVAAVAVGFACSSMLQANAKREVLREAGIMMDSARATRAYTAEEIGPLIDAQMTHKFLPQSVPSYGATQDFLKLHELHPEYSYKEAALNPTNLRDRAMDWESDLIQQFRNNPQTRELVGERNTPVGRSLYLARPIRVEQACLVCHSQPAAAPVALVERYGGNNGFGWLAQEVVAAQVVSVPLSSATASADLVLRSVMVWIGIILVGALLIVNAFLYFLVIRPVKRIASVADELSMGNLAAGDCPTVGSTELAGLARSFNRMRASLEKAMKLLES